MRKIVLTLTLTIALLFSSIAISPQIGFASTQTIVTISADGTINPTFAPIQREGEVYTLTDDVGALVIGRSGIVFNGNGHTATGTFEEKKIYLAHVKNVTLKNLVIEGSAYGILLDQTSNITVTDNIVKDTSVPFPASQGTAGIYIYGGANNTIMRNLLENNVKGIVLVNIFERNIVNENNITGNSMGMVFWNASNNSIYHNNFINNSVQVRDSDTTSIQANMTSSLNSWDNGYPYGGNYWSNYNGIGVYVIDQDNIDNYPLNRPFDIYQQSAPSPITPSPTSTPSPPTDRNAPHLDPIVYLIPVSIIVAVVLVAGLLVYHKKHKHNSVKKV